MDSPERRFPTKPSLSRREFVHSSVATVGAATLLSSASFLSPQAKGVAPIEDFPWQREPLAEVPFLPLPLGSVRARGWVLKQLELQRDGLTGHAPEVLPFLTKESSAWLARGEGDGEGWEKGPYYAKGLVPLAFILRDERLIKRATEWVEAILASQRSDGFYGPKNNDDWWPRMVTNYLLRDFAEATDDQRIPGFLTNYYQHMLRHLPDRPLGDWGKARAGDEIDTVLWLYNRTNDERLLELADLLHSQAYPWREIFTENSFLEFGALAEDFHPKHAVNVAQALKMPAVYWQRSKDDADRNAYRVALEHLMRDHGTSFGINTGTEMLSGRSTVEGVELCAMVENMLSAQTALRILGDARIGDELEMVAFNALPAAMSANFHQHVYYTLANNVSATRGKCGYEIDYADGRTPAPRSGCPCCCYNLHMGWPKLVQNAWAGGPAGLALLAYVPSEVEIDDPHGDKTRIVCDTNYPFSERVQLTVACKDVVSFALQLRIPGWCRNPEIKINGEAQKAVAAGDFTEIWKKTWQNGDRIELRFPMHTEVIRGVNNTASVRRGPLVYSLAMDETWKPFAENGRPGFESCEVTSTSPWNYALVLDEEDVANSLQFESGQMHPNPFEQGKAPVSIQATAKRIDGWKVRPDGLLPLDPPVSPVDANAPEETIQLVPFGSQMLRVTDFPVVGTPTEPQKQWSEDFSTSALENWIVYRGGAVHDRRLHLPHGAKAIATSTDFADLRLEADLTVGSKGDAGVVFRVADPSIGIDHYRGYYAGISAEAGKVVLGKADYRWIPLAEKSIALSTDKNHRLRIEARGSRIDVWLDDANEPLLRVDDDSFQGGMVGVRSYANLASFGGLRADVL